MLEIDRWSVMRPQKCRSSYKIHILPLFVTSDDFIKIWIDLHSLDSGTRRKNVAGLHKPLCGVKG